MRRDLFELFAVVEVVAKGLDLLLFDLLFLQLPFLAATPPWPVAGPACVAPRLAAASGLGSVRAGGCIGRWRARRRLRHAPCWHAAGVIDSRTASPSPGWDGLDGCRSGRLGAPARRAVSVAGGAASAAVGAARRLRQPAAVAGSVGRRFAAGSATDFASASAAGFVSGASLMLTSTPVVAATPRAAAAATRPAR